jgi:hypothetical protein
MVFSILPSVGDLARWSRRRQAEALADREGTEARGLMTVAISPDCYSPRLG